MADTLLPGLELNRVGGNGEVDKLAAHDRAGGSLDLGDSDGDRAAHGAASNGEVGTLRFLDGNGADMNIRDIKGRTPLMWAALEGQLDAARMLVVDAGVDTTLTNTEAFLGWTGLTAAQWAREQGHKKVAKFIENSAPDADAEQLFAAERDNLIDQMQHADDIHVVSTPWGGNGQTQVAPANKRGGDKAQELKARLT